jgi:hypothetical protein
MANFTVGIEREMPVYVNNIAVPAQLLIPQYTKENPFVVNGGTMHHDCSLLEFTTPPCDTGENLRISYIRQREYVRDQLLKTEDVRRRARDVVGETARSISLSEDTAVMFSQVDFMNQPENRELGCSPSRNAYGSRPIRPEGYADTKRFGGTHLNISTPDTTSAEDRSLVMAVDVAFAMPHMFTCSNPDDEQLRRELYGRAGEYRRKDFGIEFRVLSSNFLYAYSIHRVYDALEYLVECDEAYSYQHPEGVDVEGIINTMNRPAAMQVLNNAPEFIKRIHEILKSY